MGLYLSAGTIFFFFLVPKLTEANIKIKNKKTEQATQEKKKKNEQPMLTQKKKKVKRWSKVAAVGSLCVFNYNITIEL